jgi:hypothetical protein
MTSNAAVIGFVVRTVLRTCSWLLWLPPHAFLALLLCVRVSDSLDAKFWIVASFDQAFSLQSSITGS